MLKSIKKNKDGFTIIEVLIVLAIAALILVIVFLAVPALQKSARNTQRRTDVSAIVTAVSNYISDNNGNVPNDIVIGLAATPKLVTVSCVAPVAGSIPNTGCSPGTNTETANMGFYTYSTTVANIKLSATDANPAIPTATTAQVYYAPDTSCNGNGAPSATTGAFTLWYAPEGSGTSVVCLD
jgi:prepilin-type N-terminal cleavage/methylation domain-containing protein